MDNVFIITAAAAIAVTAIYFFFVRKPDSASKQTQPSGAPRDIQH